MFGLGSLSQTFTWIQNSESRTAQSSETRTFPVSYELRFRQGFEGPFSFEEQISLSHLRHVHHLRPYNHLQLCRDDPNSHDAVLGIRKRGMTLKQSAPIGDSSLPRTAGHWARMMTICRSAWSCFGDGGS